MLDHFRADTSVGHQWKALRIFGKQAAIRATVITPTVGIMTNNAMLRAILSQRGVRFPLAQDVDMEVTDLPLREVKLLLTGLPMWRTVATRRARKHQEQRHDGDDDSMAPQGRRRLRRKTRANATNDPHWVEPESFWEGLQQSETVQPDDSTAGGVEVGNETIGDNPAGQAAAARARRPKAKAK